MKLHPGGRGRRGVALVVGAALLLTAGATVIATSASAASVGTLTFSPAVGTDLTPINVSTVSAPPATGCPAGTTNARMLANGPAGSGWVNIPVVGNTTVGVSTAADFSVPLADTFAGIALGNGLTIAAGRYDLQLICQNRLGTTAFGTFDSPIFFTDPTHYQSNDPNQVAQATTTTVAAAPVSPQVAGTSVTFTARVSPAAAAGTVQFKDAAANLGTPVTVAAGAAALTTSALTAGSHAISAVFTPANSSLFTASTSAAITYVITAAAQATTTTVAAAPVSPQVAGTSVTFTATLTPATAAGTVQFKDGAINLGTPATVSAGQATLATSTLPAGSHSITAVFVPTDPATFTASTSPPLTYVISAASAQNTTTTLAASPASPLIAGIPITFTATVSPAAAGTVQFKDGAANLGTPQTVTGGQATLITSTLAVGSHSITGVFTPADPAAFNGSTSAPLPFTITPSPAQSTSTSLSPSPASPAAAGTSVTFTATVSPAAAGTVQFVDGANNVGAPVEVSAGVATLSTTTLAAGTHSITAAFTPTDPAAFLGSTSAALSYVITAAATGTTTALGANPASPAAAGTPVTFTATVSPAAAGAVQFQDGGANLGTPQTVAAGQASLSTSTLAAGTHSITAVFTPTDPVAFSGSASPAIAYVINGVGTSNLGTLTFTPATGFDVTPILLTTHSTGATAGCPAGASNVRAVVNGPTGWTNIPVLGNSTSQVSNTADFSEPVADTFAGLAQSNSLTVVAGKYDITLLCQNRLGTTVFGTFVGSLFFTDATHYQSTDPANTVTQTTTQLVVTPDARQDLAKPVTLTASVTPSTAVGAVQFKDTVGGVPTNLAGPVTVAGGTAKLVTSSLPFGMHIFSATFVPADPTKFSPSTSTSEVYVVAKPAPPKLIKRAIITGSGRIGTSLLCSATFSGATSITFTWFRNGEVISGAARSTYLLINVDRARLISCRVTARNLGGNTSSTSPTRFVGLFTFELVHPPLIFGKHSEGASLLAFPGDWSPKPNVFQYQWQRDGKAIAGANRQVYKVSRADLGHQISVKVTVQRLFFLPAVAVSRPI